MPLRVAEEFDNVGVHCSVAYHNEIVFDRSLYFSVGYGSELSIPNIVDDAVVGMSPNGFKEITASMKSLTPSDKRFFHLVEFEEAFATFSLKLLKLLKLKEVWEMTEDEKILSATQCKCRGNNHLKEENYSRALRAYKLGIQCLEGSVSVKPAKDVSITKADPKAQQLYSNLLTNTALCLLKLAARPQKPAAKSGHQPITDEKLMRHCTALCKKALELDQNNAKALYRMAQAHAQLKRYEEAISVANKAIDALKVKGMSPTIIEKSVLTWKQAQQALKREEYERVHTAFFKRAMELRKRGRLFADDESGDANRLHFDDWSNDLAKDVMSIQEELEAFGEKMPERKPVNSQSKLFAKSSKKGKRRQLSQLEAIESGDEEEEDEGLE
ncbi:hypothetical protein Aperf_G00000100508 [Anoplocephala perfoliata]